MMLSIADAMGKVDWDGKVSYGLAALGFLFAPILLVLVWFVAIAIAEVLGGCVYAGGGALPECGAAFGVIPVEGFVRTTVWAGTALDWAFIWAEVAWYIIAAYILWKVLGFLFSK